MTTFLPSFHDQVAGGQYIFKGATSPGDGYLYVTRGFWPDSLSWPATQEILRVDVSTGDMTSLSQVNNPATGPAGAFSTTYIADQIWSYGTTLVVPTRSSTCTPERCEAGTDDLYTQRTTGGSLNFTRPNYFTALGASPVGIIGSASHFLYVSAGETESDRSLYAYDLDDGTWRFMAGSQNVAFSPGRDGVGREAQFHDPLGVIQYHDQLLMVESNDVRSLSKVAGQAAMETLGGSNPSESCSARCHGGPVNAITGEFFDTTSDITIPGVGPGLTLSRSYGSSIAGTDAKLGFGWRSNYAMALEVAPGATGTGLADASEVLVRQENSSVVSFTQAADGTLTAAPRVKATLTRNGDGTFTLLRRPDQVFTFSSGGVLQKVADFNGNTTTLTYTASGLLDRATGLAGACLQLSYNAGGRVSRVADQTGRKVLYGYNTAGELTSVNDVTGGVTRFGFGPGHLLSTVTDARGGVTTNTYDAKGRVLSQQDPIGRATTWAYATGTAAGSPTGTTTVTDPAGSVTVEKHSDWQITSETVAFGTSAAATTRYSYDVTNHVDRVTGPLGKVYAFTYDTLGNRTSATDPLGRTTTWEYTQPGDRVSRTVDPTGAVTTSTYDTRGNLTSTVDPTLGKTTQTMNTNGTVATVTDPRGNAAGAAAATFTTRFGYNAAGSRNSTTGPDGAKTTVTYNGLQRPFKLIDPRGTVAGATAAYSTTFGYDPAGRQTTVTDPTGAVTTITYEPVGNTDTATDGLGQLTKYTYDQAGQRKTVTDPTGAVTTLDYDSTGRPTSVTDPRGKTTTTGYDPAGHPTSTTSARGLVTRTSYDLAGRPLTVTQPDGGTTTTSYDDAGQAVRVTDRLGKVTTQEYDLAGRPTRAVDPDGHSVTLGYDKTGRPVSTTRSDGTVSNSSYDPAGNLATTTDAAGKTTAYTYDGTGRQTAATDPLNRVTRTGYDLAGNVTTRTAADGGVTTQSVDALNRVTGIDYPGTTPEVAYGYDKTGQRTSMTDAAGTTVYGYDKAGRTISTARTAPGGTTATTVTYGYDPAGRLTALGYGSGAQTTRGYDDDNRLTSVTDGAGRTSTFTWDTGSNLTTASYPNGVTTINAYTTADQLETSTTAKAGTSQLALGYTYSPGGLATQSTATGTATANAPPQTYTYDPLRRLATVTGAPGAGTITFDAADNLTGKPTTGTATYDAAGQLQRRTGPAGDTFDYTYDGRGNRTEDTPTATPANATTYSYDTADRLTRLTAPAGTSTYRYDGDGLLASSSRTASGTTTNSNTNTTLTWDDGVLVDGLPMLLSDGTRDYLYGPDSHPYAQINRTNGTTSYLHGDLIGSTRAITDGTGAVIGASTYSAYGTRTELGTGTATSPFGYAGEYTDPSGLTYLRARFYEPVTGTFLTRDPLIAQTSAPYRYAAGNPITNTDPTGLCLGLGNGGCPGADLLYNALQAGVGRAATSTLVGIGDFASGGLTVSIREGISPGSSCTFSHNGYYYGGGVVGLASSAFVGGGPVLATRATNATRALTASERTTLSTSTTAQLLTHLFADKHKLDPLVKLFGSEEAVVEQVVRVIGGPLPAAGRFEVARVVGGQTVVIRGAVVDGVVRLGTIFTP